MVICRTQAPTFWSKGIDLLIFLICHCLWRKLGIETFAHPLSKSHVKKPSEPEVISSRVTQSHILSRNHFFQNRFLEAWRLKKMVFLGLLFVIWNLLENVWTLMSLKIFSKYQKLWTSYHFWTSQKLHLKMWFLSCTVTLSHSRNSKWNYLVNKIML